MFEKLQRKWKVSGVQLALILITFAIGGSVTGFLGKKILNLLNLRQDWLWTLIYILLVIIIWPIAVLIVSFFFGQYRFFSGYVLRLINRIGFGNDTRYGIGDAGYGMRDAGFAIWVWEVWGGWAARAVRT